MQWFANQLLTSEFAASHSTEVWIKAECVQYAGCITSLAHTGLKQVIFGQGKPYKT